MDASVLLYKYFTVVLHIRGIPERRAYRVPQSEADRIERIITSRSPIMGNQPQEDAFVWFHTLDESLIVLASTRCIRSLQIQWDMNVILEDLEEGDVRDEYLRQVTVHFDETNDPVVFSIDDAGDFHSLLTTLDMQDPKEVGFIHFTDADGEFIALRADSIALAEVVLRDLKRSEGDVDEFEDDRELDF